MLWIIERIFKNKKKTPLTRGELISIYLSTYLYGIGSALFIIGMLAGFGITTTAHNAFLIGGTMIVLSLYSMYKAIKVNRE